MTATFTSTNPNYVSGGTVTTTITVNKATPTITWDNPPDICKGKPLSYDQLGAGAFVSIAGVPTGVPGTFYYNPNVGTVLSEGQHQALEVTFVPAKLNSYNPSSKTVYIDVIKCPEEHGFFHQTEYSTYLPFQWG